MNGLIYSLLVGALSGWLAGRVMKGGGYGIFLNILLGIVGGVIGGWLLGNLVHGLLGDILKGVLGASFFIFIAGLFKK